MPCIECDRRVRASRPLAYSVAALNFAWSLTPAAPSTARMPMCDDALDAECTCSDHAIGAYRKEVSSLANAEFDARSRSTGPNTCGTGSAILPTRSEDTQAHIEIFDAHQPTAARMHSDACIEEASTHALARLRCRRGTRTAGVAASLRAPLRSVCTCVTHADTRCTDAAR
jgi:hypothetical protein